ncbi:MAG: aminoacetone oxidase family FAD-binding enzyme [Coriobacteriales bacterium]|jgi:predicted Rossmann fold flavoprotein|nr:aminoacetone oxidase family FAD-binding enzyme [Coriobacteriales bacterium]
MSTREADILIVGGGAAGLMAAIAAAHAGASVSLVEKGARAGKKILATGNGRCNLSNSAIEGASASACYNHPDFVAPVLSRYDYSAIRAVFEELGLLLTLDAKGWAFPRTRVANSVLDVMLNELGRLGIDVQVAREAQHVQLSEQGTFLVATPLGPLSSRALVLTCGVEPLPHILNDLAPKLGQILSPTPVLGPLKTDLASVKGLDGVRAVCCARLLKGESLVAEEHGEILFRRFGISGIAIFNLSRFIQPGQEISLDFFPEFERGELLSLLTARARSHPRVSAAEFLDGMLHTRLAQALLRRVGMRGSEPSENIMLDKLANTAKDYRLALLDGPDTAQAQLTRGGLAVEGFDATTLEARELPRLFAAGECLDVDGPCGGFNLHWAWASGFAAGQGAAAALRGR